MRNHLYHMTFQRHGSGIREGVASCDSHSTIYIHAHRLKVLFIHAGFFNWKVPKEAQIGPAS